MQFQNVKDKAEEVLMKQLEILENGDPIERNTAIHIMNAVSEMLKVIL